MPEGTAGSSPAAFVVTLGKPSAKTVTVHWATADGTAIAPSDYTAASGNLSFAPGDTSKPVSVSVLGDTTDENDETFSVVLSSPVNAPIADGTGMGTITNDDVAPTLSVSDTSVGEGDVGTTTMSFTVSLSAASEKTVTVHAATADGTALAPRDYAATSSDLTFAPGETSKQVDVTVATDLWYELDETLSLGLSSPVHATLADDTGVGTITNDDAVIGIDISDVSVAEGDAGTTQATFDVTLSGPSGLVTSVDWATVDGTATAGVDYAAVSGTLSFAAGVTSQQVSVPVVGDTTDEPDETFTVSLSNPLNAGLATPSGVGTITDDDPSVTALTMTVKKAKRTVTGKGLLEPATSGMSVTVTLLKTKGSRYVKVGARTVQVTSLFDRDGDSLVEGAYVARFKRPTSGSYKLTATYAGSIDFLPSSVSKRVKL
jgi:chitinase